MVKVININYCLKDSFKSIRRWRRMDEDDFSNKIIVILNSSKSVNEKFSVKGSTLELEYVALNNFISYNNKLEEIDILSYESNDLDLFLSLWFFSLLLLYLSYPILNIYKNK